MAWSTGAVEAIEDWLPAASWMPVALTARTTRKVPTAVFWAPAPSAMTSVAVAPEVETEESVPDEGTFVSVQGAVSVEAASVSEKVACTRSTLPFAVTSCMTSMSRDEDRLGAVRRPRRRKRGEVAGGIADPGRARGKSDRERAHGGVGTPAPSVIVSVATADETETEASVPPEGTFASVHGVVPAE